MQLCLHHF